MLHCYRLQFLVQRSYWLAASAVLQPTQHGSRPHYQPCWLQQLHQHLFTGTLMQLHCCTYSSQVVQQMLPPCRDCSRQHWKELHHVLLMQCLQDQQQLQPQVMDQQWRSFPVQMRHSQCYQLNSRSIQR